jgi:hypothetical protein
MRSASGVDPLKLPTNFIKKWRGFRAIFLWLKFRPIH